jgi:serine/threonine protein kinase
MQDNKPQNITIKTLYNEKYLSISQIGSGGMAHVWRVLDTKFEIERAIKTLRSTQKQYSFESFSQQPLSMENLLVLYKQSYFTCGNEIEFSVLNRILEKIYILMALNIMTL